MIWRGIYESMTAEIRESSESMMRLDDKHWWSGDAMPNRARYLKSLFQDYKFFFPSLSENKGLKKEKDVKLKDMKSLAVRGKRRGASQLERHTSPWASVDVAYEPLVAPSASRRGVYARARGTARAAWTRAQAGCGAGAGGRRARRCVHGESVCDRHSWESCGLVSVARRARGAGTYNTQRDAASRRLRRGVDGLLPPARLCEGQWREVDVGVDGETWVDGDPGKYFKEIRFEGPGQRLDLGALKLQMPVGGPRERGNGSGREEEEN
ncbi:hypothetical protein GGX14DRAFT_397890 [Mycena pura]|uniref:Uncharacterized protein n=1 Tax=Mycena pura TaxID=153505 RepID=A0AAD6Y712_9AGAR|nr:hypothetical protein GGX14DRAFT_397890 [Mycena pura]